MEVAQNTPRLWGLQSATTSSKMGPMSSQHLLHIEHRHQVSTLDSYIAATFPPPISLPVELGSLPSTGPPEGKEGARKRWEEEETHSRMNQDTNLSFAPSRVVFRHPISFTERCREGGGGKEREHRAWREWGGKECSIG